MQTIIYDPKTHVLVPIKPTETMIVEGFESRPDELFSTDEEWEKYSALTGCEQAAYCAEKCWSAMLAAVPPQSSCTEKSNNSIPSNSRELESSGQASLDNCREALKWTAAALSAVVKIKHFSEKDRFLMDDRTGKSIREILDMANAALEQRS